MESLITSLGLWNWVILGIILLLLELALPGVFFVWLGIGALLTALVTACINWGPFSGWEAQTILFLAFSVIMVFIGRNFFRRERETDQPLLNRRTAQMVGRVTILEEPIVGGQGHVRIDDTIWRIRGVDLPAGTQIRLVDFNDGVFDVEKKN